MPGKAAKVTVTERQHEILLTLRNATTAPAPSPATSRRHPLGL